MLRPRNYSLNLLLLALIIAIPTLQQGTSLLASSNDDSATVSSSSQQKPLNAPPVPSSFSPSFNPIERSVNPSSMFKLIKDLLSKVLAEVYLPPVLADHQTQTQELLQIGLSCKETLLSQEQEQSGKPLKETSEYFR